jgi:hypothetical protein
LNWRAHDQSLGLGAARRLLCLRLAGTARSLERQDFLAGTASFPFAGENPSIDRDVEGQSLRVAASGLALLLDVEEFGYFAHVGRARRRYVPLEPLPGINGVFGRRNRPATRCHMSGAPSEAATSRSSVRQVCSRLARLKGNRMASMEYRNGVAREGGVRQTGLFGHLPWSRCELARGSGCLDRKVGRGSVLGAVSTPAHDSRTPTRGSYGARPFSSRHVLAHCRRWARSRGGGARNARNVSHFVRDVTRTLMLICHISFYQSERPN